MTTPNHIFAAMQEFNIARDIAAPGSPIGLSLQATDNIAAAAAILAGAGFPRSADIVTLQLKASTGATVPLPDPAGGTVAFSAAGSAGFALRLLPDVATASKAVGCHAQISGPAGARFLLLDLRYDATLSAKGTAALGMGATATFGSTASRARDWKVLHRVGDTTAVKAIADTLASWLLPGHIDSPAQLAPGTWIAAETDGSLSIHLGARAGYDFSWIRAVSGGGLTGDLGLKLQAASASFGFSAGGTCSVVVSRETEAPVLRVAVFKNSRQSREFNAAAGISSVLTAKPGDLAAAILGIHPAQLVEDLRAIAPQFESFYTLWDKLGAQPASTLLSLAMDHAPEAIRHFSGVLDEIASVATNPLKVVPILEREIANPAFFATPLGQLLSSSFRSFALSLQDLNVVRHIAQYAGAARDFLRGEMPPQIITALDKLPPFNQLDTLVKRKLAGFLGKTAAEYKDSDHRSLDQLYATLLAKAQGFLSATMQAARRQLEAKFVATCQSADSNTALIDVEFDFGVNPGLTPLFRSAVNGDFTSLVVDTVAGVRLHKGALTHGVDRQVHVDLSLPYFDSSSSNLLQSVAKLTATDDNGRVLVYELNASDEWIAQSKARFARDSRLSVSGTIPASLAGVRRYGAAQASVGYSLTAGFRSLNASSLERYVDPILAEYFPDPLKKPSVDLGAVAGDIRISLDVELPADAMTEWLAAPLDARDPVYFKFSRLLQARLKSIVSNVYFSDPSRYSTLGVAGPLVVWASLPPMNSFDGRDLVWDASCPESFDRMVSDLRTRQAVREKCAAIAPLLAGSQKLRRAAQFYDVSNPRVAPGIINSLLASALRRPSAAFTRPALLGALVSFEQEIVRSAVRAAVEAARFREDAAARPAEAIRHLAKFGEGVAVTFHEKLRGNLAIPAEAFAPLGAGLFAEAARALHIARTGDDSGIRPAVLFSVTLLKPGSKLTPDELRRGAFPHDRIEAERRIAA